MRNQFFDYICKLQDTISTALEKIDCKAKFKEDLWDRPEGGGGRTRVIEHGALFEKGGVNISGVHGTLPVSMQTHFNVSEASFYACGLSLVLHPKNPHVPTVHANWRYFELYDSQGRIADQWFGGGLDLTPYYLYREDSIHFHQTCKAVCDRHHTSLYKKYKKRCDEYFWNTHRKEARGIGGLFFDYLKADQKPMKVWYAFVTDIADHFLKAYLPIVEKRKDTPYTDAQKKWQEIRRGRYV
ncbi:MAG: oxygen-dependent coproporphyrinogen oxidase, partial [Burkholderiaceae bacterium]